MTTPRAYTVEEMRVMFFRHIHAIADNWITTDLTRPEFLKAVAKDGELRYRMEGMIFSFLVLLDGGAGMMPAFDLSPSPHESDEEFHRSEGSNWWPKGVVINECQLHELWSMWKRGEKP